MGHPWSTDEFKTCAKTYSLENLTHKEYRVRIAAGNVF